MKKILVLMLALMPMFCLVSCDKPGGKETKKISKVYQHKYDGSKVLSREYIWDKDNIQQIVEYYTNGDISTVREFVYNGSVLDKVLFKSYVNEDDYNTGYEIDITDVVYDFTWNGKEIAKEECFYDDELVFVVDFVYTDGKITGLNTRYNTEKGLVLPKSLLDNPFMEGLIKLTAEKASKAEDYSVTVSYQYTGDNVTALVMSMYGMDITYNVTYNEGFNPLYNILDLGYFLSPDVLSKNNYTKISASQAGYNMETEYFYEYDKDNYPVLMGSDGAVQLYYEYTK